MPTKNPRPRRKRATSEIPAVVPHLRTLLHAVRCIAQHEDALCTLLHNLQNYPEKAAELTVELRTLLDQLPSGDYLDDLDAVLQGLPTVQTANSLDR